MLKRIDFNGNPYLGVFCRANNKVAFVHPFLTEKEKKIIEEVLRVKVVELTIGGSTIAGSLIALNSYGAVVTDFIEEEEIECMRKHFDGNILVIKDKFNAAGNNILANDYGALIHPMMKDETVEAVAETLDVKVERGTIAEVQTVGMAAVATNNGILCHPKIKDDERKRLEELLNVEVKIGTVNHGVPYVGAGIVANIRGAIMSTNTTGIEMGRIEDALNFIGD
ncbi:MAG: translation initiation factor IF-6 [Thermoplasmata archaeon]|nr:MAG: translation initiation factor IF-6 [Thermoplasmata archaeon]